MSLRAVHGRWLYLLVAFSFAVLVLQTSFLPAATILFHGSGVEPVDGADGDVMAHLQSVYGAANVTYMQGEQAAADGSSADGFDAVVISATLNSGTVRNKYEDAPQGVLNWESALMRQAEGEFNMSVDGNTQDDQTQIEIVDPGHPLAVGLSGVVTVTSAPGTMSRGAGDIGAGVSLVASTMDGNHAIFAANVGDALLGDGSAGNPATAPGTRVMFFLQDNNFSDLTPEGLALFDASVAYVVPEPTSLTLCVLGFMGLLGARSRRRRMAN